MRSLFLTGPQTIEVREAPRPELTDPASAVVMITGASICGSDLGPYVSGSHFGGHAVGHEAVGFVEAVGDAVTTLSIGDRVAVLGTAGCGTCGPCQRDEAMLCDANPWPPVYGHGFPGLGGGQSEALLVPMADFNLVTLPDSVPDEVGVLLADTLATASSAVERATQHGGGTVAVIGLGAVGLQAVLVAFARGACRVIAFDPVAERRSRAEEFGAETHDPLAGELPDLGKVDAIVDAKGSGDTLALALGLIRKGGDIAVVGIPADGVVSLPAQMALGKSVTIHYVACSIQTQVYRLLSELESGALPTAALSSLFTDRVTLEQGSAAYERFASREGGTIKTMILPNHSAKEA